VATINWEGLGLVPEWISFGRGKFFQAWSMGDGEARLDHFFNGLVGEKYGLADYEPFILRLTSPSNYSAANPAPLDEVRASECRVEKIIRRREAAQDVLEIEYAASPLAVIVSYCASRDRLWIRKHARIINRGQAVRLVAVALHDFGVGDGRHVELLDCGYRFSTPLYGSTRLPDEYVTRLGMPSVLWGDGGGLLMGIQFPACHNTVSEAKGRFSCDYRPGILLESGSEYTTETAFYLPFAGHDRAALRRTFFDYVEETYPPRLPSLVRFNCAGTWLEQVNRPRALPMLPLVKEMGAEVFVIDFGGTHYERFPFSFGHPDRLPSIEQIEQGICRRELFPGGWDEFNAELQKVGLRLGLHYETQGFPHLEEMPEWRLKSPINEGYCLCTPYGDLFSKLVLTQATKYQLGEIKLDYFTTEPCCAEGHDHMVDGYDSTDKQVLQHLELLRQCREAVPDLVIALFVGGGYTSPWWARYADQLHSGDPGHQLMFKVMLEDNAKSEAVAIERRERWHWATGQAMRPPYCVQMDVHGFGIQSTGTVASRMDPATDDSIPTGAGWRQTLFSNLALTGARDIKLNPYYLTKEERAFVARWFDWGKRNSSRLRRPKSILSPTNGQDLEGYAHTDQEGGFLFLFNPSDKSAATTLELEMIFGAGPWRVKALYPVEGGLKISSTLDLPVMAKDCVVVEIERGKTIEEAPSISRYRNIAGEFIRPYQPHVVGGSLDALVGLRGRDVQLTPKIGETKAEQRLERQLLRLLDVASMGRAGKANGATVHRAAQVHLAIAGLNSDASDNTRRNSFVRDFATLYFRAPDGALVDGCAIGFDDPVKPNEILFSATAPEHLERALDMLEDNVLSSGFVRVRRLDDPSAFEVVASGGKVGPLGPHFGQGVRVLSAFSERAPFALADVVIGASAKMLVGPHAARGLAKPPSQCRGYVAIPPAEGMVEARTTFRIPANGQPLLELGIGLADQPNPRYGVNLAAWGTHAHFSVELRAGSGAVTILEEDVFPELYPSGEVPEYESLVARGFRVGFMRRQLLDLTRWRGQEVELCLSTKAPTEYQALYTVPVWSPPQLLVGKHG
jgi:hypothetical protein